MKALFSAIALSTLVAAAASAAQPGSTPPAATGPVQLTDAQLDTITAGESKLAGGDPDPVTALGRGAGAGPGGNDGSAMYGGDFESLPALRGRNGGEGAGGND
jgi:hypothetical protein